MRLPSGIKTTIESAGALFGFRVWSCLVLLNFVAVAAASRPIARHAPAVRIDSGVLEGLPVRGLSHGAAFLGIPYAAAPIGELRWRPPQAAAQWVGSRKATQYGPACPQTPSPWLPEMLGRNAMVTDEACLFLNVWTPKLDRKAALPVLIWVHGGGNVEGSGEWPPLGETLARHGVVVVSIHYRLGIFGFFTYAPLSAESPHRVSGNYGHLDQVAALQWVRGNIRSFGGDPDRVTIAGASSGALDICNLMASPLTAGLFRHAILQSGVCVDSVFPTLKQAEVSNALFAKGLTAPADPSSLARLRAMPAQRILEAAAGDQSLDLEPVVDRWFLPQQPALAFQRGEQMRVPVLVGSNENEVSIFASPIVGGTSYRPQTVADYRQWLNKRFGVFADRVFAAYPAHSDSEATAIFTTMDTDFDFGFAAELMARETALVREPAFLYHFTYVGAGHFAPLGAFHIEESMFLSKKYWTSWIRRPYDERLSKAIIDYWIAFIKTGDPNQSGLPAWPAFDPKAERCQMLGATIGPAPVPRSQSFRVFQDRLGSRLVKVQAH